MPAVLRMTIEEVLGVGLTITPEIAPLFAPPMPLMMPEARKPELNIVPPELTMTVCDVLGVGLLIMPEATKPEAAPAAPVLLITVCVEK